MPSRVALNHVSLMRPGTASIFTPKAGTDQLWITSAPVVSTRTTLFSGTTCLICATSWSCETPGFAEIEIRRLSLPTRVYADMTPLRAGLVLSRDDLLEKLDRLGFWHVGEELPKQDGAVDLFLSEQELFFARARAEDVNGWVDAAICNLAIQHELHVAGALELLEDQFVHPASGFDQRGRDNRHTTPDVRGSAPASHRTTTCPVIRGWIEQ